MKPKLTDMNNNTYQFPKPLEVVDFEELIKDENGEPIPYIACSIPDDPSDYCDADGNPLPDDDINLP